MIHSDFEKNRILNFHANEVESTGAKLEDIDVQLMISFQKFRTAIGVPVQLIKNGMTTGKHTSIYHPAGKAGDAFTTTPVPVSATFKAALNAGFKGVGIYWNGTAYSYHLDIGEGFRFWTGRKRNGKSWLYDTLIVDPKILEEN